MSSVHLRCNNTSGVEGVYYDIRRERWVAVMRHKGVKYNLGKYQDKEAAIEARSIAEARAKNGLTPKDEKPRKNKKRSGRNKMVVGPQPQIRRFAPGDSAQPTMLKDWLAREFGDRVLLHRGMRNRFIVNDKEMNLEEFYRFVDSRRRQRGLPPIVKENGSGK